MSGVDYLKDAVAALFDMILGILGWIFIAPLAALVPKRRDWIAVIGRGDGKFLDNTKYFFIEASLKQSLPIRVVHVTERDDVQALILGAGMHALRFPSFEAVWFLIRCGTVVVDSIEWCEKGRCFLLSRAKKIQLWHGVGFKRIEHDKWRNEARNRRNILSPLILPVRIIRKRLRGRIPKYDVVVTTSEFYRSNVFGPAFRHHHVLITGYPRNTFGQLTGQGRHLAWENVDPVVKGGLESWRHSQRKIVLVSPTFRDTRATPLGLDQAMQARLDSFCSAHGYEILFKFHPYEHGAIDIDGQHLYVLNPDSDVYPLLPYLDAMVTDYSSIYMDFLLLDRPILFFTPDLTQYLAQDRDLQFDFEHMTPGPKLNQWEDLLQALLGADNCQKRRTQIRDLAFDGIPQAKSTDRLLAFMLKQGWIRAGAHQDGDKQNVA